MSMINSVEDLKNLEEYVGSYSALIENAKTLLASFDHEEPKNMLSNVVETQSKRTERLQQTKEEAKLLDNKIKTTKIEKSKCHDSIKELREKLNKLKSDRENILREKEMAKSKLHSTNESIKKLENRSEMDTSDLEKDLNLFRDVFGLDLQKKKGGMTVVFRYIFQTNPDRLCSFDLMIENNKYRAEKFSPDVGDVSKLLDSLNAHNNLGEFITNIRNRFKQLEEK